MIIKLNTDSSITVVPQSVPENLKSIRVSYIFPKGLNHLKPILTWGGEVFEGNNMYISKTNTKFDMKVVLYNGEEVYKTYKTKEEPSLFVCYGIYNIRPDIIEYIKALEKENKELKERGDII